MSMLNGMAPQVQAPVKLPKGNKPVTRQELFELMKTIPAPQAAGQRLQPQPTYAIGANG
jgi:hypothetical protein